MPSPEAFCAGSLLLFCAETTSGGGPEEWFEETCDGAWQSPLNHRRNSASFKPVSALAPFGSIQQVDFSADAELSSANFLRKLGPSSREPPKDVLLDVKVRELREIGVFENFQQDATTSNFYTNSPITRFDG